MTCHGEVLSEAQVAVLGLLGPRVDARGFHLGGGTAVALHVGHRLSVDLDWFTPDELADPLRLAARLRSEGIELDVTGTDEGTLHAVVGGVRTTFLEYRYPLLGPLLQWPETGVRLASLEDLACAKLSAIAGRGASRDFLDVFAIVESGLTLERMLALYAEKFGVEDPGHVLRSLVYFDDAERETMPRMLHELSWTEVRESIEGWVAQFVEGSA